MELPPYSRLHQSDDPDQGDYVVRGEEVENTLQRNSETEFVLRVINKESKVEIRGLSEFSSVSGGKEYAQCLTLRFDFFMILCRFKECHIQKYWNTCEWAAAHI